ncbi:MAG: putative transporter ATP-binding protein, partial [Chloroflexi bacterium]|nr:putative transporter ATP-binding protein [Chloroflexota bacterium]
LFTIDSVELHRQECAALIGPNGSGKTTFLRTILGQLKPLAGEVQHGASLHIGYFAQAHDALKPENSVLNELLDHRNMPIGQARNHLAQYLFRGEDVHKKVSMLSGGERGRLALAILAIDGSNFLLLDEPTNHLDIPAQEVLQEGLERFEGTLLLVSHDRYLVDRLATQIWELRDGQLVVFNGTYREYLTHREREAVAEKETAAGVRAQAVQAAKADTQVNQKEARKRAQRINTLETQISEMETLIAECERSMQQESEAQRYEEVRRLADEHGSAQAQLAALMEYWLALSAE